MKQTSIYLWLICLVSAMGGLLFGYDWVVVGGAKIFYEPFFQIEADAAMRGWAMSSALVGCLVGALLSGSWSDRYGRRRMLIVSAWLFLISAIGTGIVDSFFWFIIYRIVGGLGIGIASNVSPVYIAEVSPAHVRGKFVSINQLTIVLGILLAQIANWLIGEHFTAGSSTLTPHSIEWAWRWMIWAETIPAALFLLLAFFIPESPRWLLVQHKQKRAQMILTKIGGISYANETISSLQQITSQKVETEGWSALRNRRFRKVLFAHWHRPGHLPAMVWHQCHF